MGSGAVRLYPGLHRWPVQVGQLVKFGDPIYWRWPPKGKVTAHHRNCQPPGIYLDPVFIKGGSLPSLPLPDPDAPTMPD